jgi:hypothetical protein
MALGEITRRLHLTLDAPTRLVERRSARIDLWLGLVILAIVVVELIIRR